MNYEEVARMQRIAMESAMVVDRALKQSEAALEAALREIRRSPYDQETETE